MGHVAVCVHHCFPRGSLGSQSSCPCSLLAPAVVGAGWPGRPLAQVPWWAAEVVATLALSCLPFGGAGCWRRAAGSTRCLTQGWARARVHPCPDTLDQLPTSLLPALGLGPASRRQSPVSLSSAGDPSCSEFPVPSASSQAHSTFLSLPAGQEGFLFPLLGLV